MTELRFAQGVSSAVDVLQQRSQLDDTVSLIPSSEAAYVVFENRLDVLAGKHPTVDSKRPKTANSRCWAARRLSAYRASFC
ncbi:MAG: hypothetical protein R3B51_13050 [Thermodesulfobacteriota bacterium]